MEKEKTQINYKPLYGSSGKVIGYIYGNLNQYEYALEKCAEKHTSELKQ